MAKNTAIVYAIQATKLFKIGTYSNKTAVRMINDQDIIRKYGPLVAISTDDGTILQSITVDVIDPDTGTIVYTEQYYDSEAARHFAVIMNYKGYNTNIH